jgi:hypothetical protein
MRGHRHFSSTCLASGKPQSGDVVSLSGVPSITRNSLKTAQITPQAATPGTKDTVTTLVEETRSTSTVATLHPSHLRAMSMCGASNLLNPSSPQGHAVPPPDGNTTDPATVTPSQDRRIHTPAPTVAASPGGHAIPPSGNNASAPPSHTPSVGRLIDNQAFVGTIIGSVITLIGTLLAAWLVEIKRTRDRDEAEELRYSQRAETFRSHLARAEACVRESRDAFLRHDSAPVVNALLDSAMAETKQAEVILSKLSHEQRIRLHSQLQYPADIIVHMAAHIQYHRGTADVRDKNVIVAVDAFARARAERCRTTGEQSILKEMATVDLKLVDTARQQRMDRHALQSYNRIMEDSSLVGTFFQIRACNNCAIVQFALGNEARALKHMRAAQQTTDDWFKKHLNASHPLYTGVPGAAAVAGLATQIAKLQMIARLKESTSGSFTDDLVSLVNAGKRGDSSYTNATAAALECLTLPHLSATHPLEVLRQLIKSKTLPTSKSVANSSECSAVLVSGTQAAAATPTALAPHVFRALLKDAEVMKRLWSR